MKNFKNLKNISLMKRSYEKKTQSIEMSGLSNLVKIQIEAMELVCLMIFYEISGILNELAGRSRRTSILQKYIHNPLLINKRKFDIRIYTMVTCYNQGYVKAYYYTEGYLRTS